MSPQYLTFLALPYIQEHWEHLTLINKLLCIFVHYLSFSLLIHIQIIFRKGKKVSGVWGLGKSNEVRSGTAHLLCSVPQQCIMFVGMWRRKKMWRVPSLLLHPKTSQVLNKHQLPSFLPLKKPCGFTHKLLVWISGRCSAHFPSFLEGKAVVPRQFVFLEYLWLAHSWVKCLGDTSSPALQHQVMAQTPQIFTPGVEFSGNSGPRKMTCRDHFKSC